MPPKRLAETETNLQAAKRQRIMLTEHDINLKEKWVAECQKRNQQHALENYLDRQRALWTPYDFFLAETAQYMEEYNQANPLIK